MVTKYDFCGWATKNDLKCSDGRTIRRDAFKDDDGKEVPIVWNHEYGSVDNVLGHAMLLNRPEGMYTYGVFNDTENGQTAKKLVDSGDIKCLSIYANHLKQNKQTGEVFHGAIREVSLVLAGANPGAVIESVLSHADDGDEIEEMSIRIGKKDCELTHGDIEYETPDDTDANTVKHADEGKETNMNETMTKEASGEKTVQDVLDTFTEDQKTVMYALIAAAVEDANKNENKNSEEGTMKQNVFDTDTKEDSLSHDDMMTIINDGKRYGSLKESFLQHADDYGIENIEYLFPDAKNVTTTPETVDRDQTWVGAFLNGTKHTPFANVKSQAFDLTEDEARAKGYLKGNLKMEEVITLSKRVTTPCTVYKKQKLDRDDVVDITDFDVVAYLKGEMRGKLNEELARAMLVGDGRSSSSDDKINEQNIRPIWTDTDFFTIKKLDTYAANATDDDKAKAFIKTFIKSRRDYKGSGNLTMFITEDMLDACLLVEDGIGHTLYDTVEKLAAKLRVGKIVAVPVMENLTRTVSGATHTLNAIALDLRDYNVGADKGGSVNMFDDFDIDYNQMKYLIETRCSGALVKPYSAIVMEGKNA